MPELFNPRDIEEQTNQAVNIVDSIRMSLASRLGVEPSSIRTRYTVSPISNLLLENLSNENNINENIIVNRNIPENENGIVEETSDDDTFVDRGECIDEEDINEDDVNDEDTICEFCRDELGDEDISHINNWGYTPHFCSTKCFESYIEEEYPELYKKECTFCGKKESEKQQCITMKKKDKHTIYYCDTECYMEHRKIGKYREIK